MTYFAIVFFALSGAALLTRTSWLLFPTAFRFTALGALVAIAHQGHREQALAQAEKMPPSAEVAKPAPAPKKEGKKSKRLKSKRHAGRAAGIAIVGCTAAVVGAGIAIYNLDLYKS